MVLARQKRFVDMVRSNSGKDKGIEEMDSARTQSRCLVKAQKRTKQQVLS